MFVDTGVKTFTSGTTHARGLRVILSSSVTAAAGALDRELGTILSAVVVSGDPAAVMLRSKQGTCEFVAAGVVAVGDRVYGAASGKVSTTANSNPIGTALTAAAGDGEIIEVLRDDGVGGKLYTNVASSAEHENTQTEALFDKSVSIPANSLKAGDVIHVVAAVTVNDNNSTDTLTLVLYLGGLTGVAIISTAAVDVADADVGYIDAWITLRTVGANGTLVATGIQGLGVPGTVTAKPWVKASTAIDTTAALTVGVGADWSVAHADNEAELTSLIVEVLRA
jgi:hypothetical protein